MGKREGADPSKVKLEDWLTTDPPRARLIEQQYPEAAKACRTYAKVFVSGKCRVSIPRFCQTILEPMGCMLTVNTIKKYIRECVGELGSE